MQKNIPLFLLSAIIVVPSNSYGSDVLALIGKHPGKASAIAATIKVGLIAGWYFHTRSINTENERLRLEYETQQRKEKTAADLARAEALAQDVIKLIRNEFREELGLFSNNQLPPAALLFDLALRKHGHQQYPHTAYHGSLIAAEAQLINLWTKGALPEALRNHINALIADLKMLGQTMNKAFAEKFKEEEKLRWENKKHQANIDAQARVITLAAAVETTQKQVEVSQKNANKLIEDTAKAAEKAAKGACDAAEKCAQDRPWHDKLAKDTKKEILDEIDIKLNSINSSLTTIGAKVAIIETATASTQNTANSIDQNVKGITEAQKNAATQQATKDAIIREQVKTISDSLSAMAGSVVPRTDNGVNSTDTKKTVVPTPAPQPVIVKAQENTHEKTLPAKAPNAITPTTTTDKPNGVTPPAASTPNTQVSNATPQPTPNKSENSAKA